MSDNDLDSVLGEIHDKIKVSKNTESKKDIADIKIETKVEDEKKANIEVKEKTTEDETKDIGIEEEKSVKNDKKVVEDKPDLEKQVKSLEKALNDTKKTYQTTNQKFILSKKKFNSTIEELKSSILDPDNTYLDEVEFKDAVNKLTSIFDFKEDELETKDDVSKTDNKSKTILEKIETEFQNFKKYNKSKEIDTNYNAFYDSVHLLNIDERQNLFDYLEEADPTDAIEKLLLLGQDYRNIFEKGLKKHKNIFAFVNSLQDEISKLNEQINTNKESVDNYFDKNDNKQIHSRSSSFSTTKKYDDHLQSLFDM
jgi:hypothetical protein